jgi:hypothetical protein
LGDLNINGDYVFSAGDYVVGNLNINGNPKISTEGGLVRIWFNNVNLAGKVNVSGDPGELWFFSRLGSQQFNINGNCTLFGVIYAPNITVIESGNGGHFGAVVGNQVILNGNTQLHYDEDLGASCPTAAPPSLAWVF